MSHLPFIIAAYAVFFLVLGSDALGSWLRLRLARRQALRRQQRLQARAQPQTATPLAPELSR
ncbi:heme exporter protein CcmD [Stenotrophomonas rhizophila]|uniref:heme exporter protein CcmD n=1 Tax=Stenotrophomonas rhizophila TaxID=216778 RepID=UPI001E2BBDA2|nr:heme exporter protein CcmD [Stenotrophomonas rhizophila]MCC7635192.1 heme exporter protein CcmD [Stenotrophomonas rhizophila]MCC7664593.1 heme exporter protein CcmD [Stenotrophomonas rhizophila]